MHPERLSLATHPNLIATGAQAQALAVPPFVMPDYLGLVRRLRNAFVNARVDTAVRGVGRDLSANIVVFPYDFRRSIVETAELLEAEVAARVAEESVAGDGSRRQVVIIAHSLGGLVARWWLGPLGGAPKCRALITLGTPYRGAPKALDWLVNGVRVRGHRLAAHTAMLRGWPSVYELLPRYPAIASAMAVAGDPEAAYPHDLGDIAGSEFAAKAKTAYETHQVLRSSWLDLAAGDPAARPVVHALYGRDHKTPFRATVDGSKLIVDKRPPSWIPNADWQGDGTVPAVSAIPDELGDFDIGPLGRYPVPHRHREIAGASEAVRLLLDIEGESLAALHGPADVRPSLGLDLDDLQWAGEPIPLGVTLHGAVPDETTRVWVSVTGPEGEPVGSAEGTPADDGWQAELAALPVGQYRVRVEAVGVPDVDQVVCEDTILVMDE